MPDDIERGPGRPRGGYRAEGGEKIPSTTTVLAAMDAKPGLQAWRMRHCFDEGFEYGAARPQGEPTQKEIKTARERAARNGFRPDVIGREAGDVGTAVHDAIESDIHGDDPIATLDAFPLSPQQHKEALKALGAWQTWRTRNAHLRFTATEIPLISDELGYAGTIDGVADDCGRVYCIDFKTSGRYYLSHIYQIGAYVRLLEECRGVTCDDALVLRFCKKSGRPTQIHLGGNALKQATAGFLGRLREFKRDAAFTRMYSTQLNPPRRKKVS